MRKFWKIFGITAGSLLGVVLLAVGIAMYVVLTPKKLTPVVDKVAQELLNCDYDLGNVELTFFSTFPRLGLEIKGLYLINPMEGAQSDTLLAAPKVILDVDVDEFLNNKTLYVHKIDLDELEANVFINENGETNFNVFITDTTDNDTTKKGLPFDKLGLDNVKFVANRLTFVDLRDSIDAELYDTKIGITLPVDYKKLCLDLTSHDVNAMIGTEKYADHLSLDLHLPCDVTLDSTMIDATLNAAKVKINDFELGLAGNIRKEQDMALNVDFTTNQWDALNLLELLPNTIRESLASIALTDGDLQIEHGHVEGVLNDSLLPIISANITVTDASGRIADLPYDLREVQGNVDLLLDLNNDSASALTINKVTAQTKKTEVEVTGQITELLADMLLDLQMEVDLNIADLAYFLPEKMQINGRAEGPMSIKMRLSDLTDLRFAKGKMAANLNVQKLDFDFDSILVNAAEAKLKMQIPNKQSAHKTTTWSDISLDLPKGADVEIINTLKADLQPATITVESSDILSSSAVIYANVGLKSSQIVAQMDSMGGTLQDADLLAYVEYDTKDTVNIPTMEASLAFSKLQGFYDDIKAQLEKSTLAASLTGSKRNKALPKLTASLHTDALDADVNGNKIVTRALTMSASARRNPKKDNLLLQWNPKLSFDLKEGDVKLTSLDQNIEIPYITFDYSNRDFTISKSQIQLGKSDFALTGEVKDIGKWLDKKGDLEGTLNFVSNHTDVNEIMDLVSADHGSEETVETTVAVVDESNEQKALSEPFLVPTNVNLTLNTNIKEAIVFDQLARELGGRIYVQNGILVLEEVGFICNAAKLQLTAMYKTPKKDHIYLGLDYHMLNINIQELVNMIPQIDTMLPMLRSFRGAAEFHLAAETYLNQKYEIKTSTLRGACDIEGKDLVLLDNETFTKIAKILMFNKKTENKVDSLSAQISLFKDVATVYPFCISIDNYMAAVGGQHYLDMTFDYHASLLKPLYIGVDVKGSFDDLKIRPGTCKYVQDFRPIIHKDVETQSMALKKVISENIKKTVIIKEDE